MKKFKDDLKNGNNKVSQSSRQTMNLKSQSINDKEDHDLISF